MKKQHIALMSRIGICYANCCLATPTVSPTLPGFQGIKLCAQYMDIRPHKPIFNPSNCYYGSNVIRLTWTGDQVEDYKTQNCLEFHQDSDHTRILNIIRSVLVILLNLLGVFVF